MDGINMTSAAQALENLQSGTYGTEGSLLDFLIYDRITLAVATLSHTMFQAPVGQAGRTLADTNMQQAGVVPQGQNWKIHALKISIHGVAPAAAAVQQDLINLLNESTGQFIVNNKAAQYQAPLAEMLGLSLGEVPTITQGNAAFGVVKGITPLNREITLAALTPFQFVVNHWTAPAASLVGYKIRIGLIADLARAGS